MSDPVLNLTGTKFTEADISAHKAQSSKLQEDVKALITSSLTADGVFYEILTGYADPAKARGAASGLTNCHLLADTAVFTNRGPSIFAERRANRKPTVRKPKVVPTPEPVQPADEPLPAPAAEAF